MMIVLLILVLILFGGGYYGMNAGYAPSYGYGGFGIGGLLLIVLVLYLMGVL